MFTKLLKHDPEQLSPVPKEGNIFKIIQLYGKTFELIYGFYEERDRHTHYAEPVAIYPDFIEHPQYTDDGIPFVTAMQVPCRNFEGKKSEDSGCGDCGFYRHGEELIGNCACPKNRKGMESAV